MRSERASFLWLFERGWFWDFERTVMPEFLAREIDFVIPGNSVATWVNFNLFECFLIFYLREYGPFLEERLHIVNFFRTSVVCKNNAKLVVRERGDGFDVEFCALFSIVSMKMRWVMLGLLKIHLNDYLIP